MRLLNLSLFFCLFLSVSAPFAKADGDPAQTSSAQARRSTNVQVDTRDLGPINLNEKLKPTKEKSNVYSDDNLSLGFNDDGDPNVGMRF